MMGYVIINGQHCETTKCNDINHFDALLHFKNTSDIVFLVIYHGSLRHNLKNVDLTDVHKIVYVEAMNIA
jgi:hypothetical protein